MRVKRPTPEEVRAALRFYKPDPAFGEWLRDQRVNKLEWTQPELAFALKVAPEMICRWEKGRPCQSEKAIRDHVDTIVRMVGKASRKG